MLDVAAWQRLGTSLSFGEMQAGGSIKLLSDEAMERFTGASSV